MGLVIFLIEIFIMTISGSFGALFLKKGVEKIGLFNIKKLLMSFEIYLGGLMYFIGAVSNILLLRSYDYTFVYPLTSLTYVWTMIISLVILHEKVNTQKVAALMCILAGTFLIKY